MGPPAKQTAAPGTKIPMGNHVAGGKGIVLQSRRSRFMTALAHSGSEPKPRREGVFKPLSATNASHELQVATNPHFNPSYD